MAGSLGLHVIVVAAAVMAVGAQRLGIDDAAAITVYVEPNAAPVATAREILPPAAPAPESEPQAIAAAEAPKEPALPDFAPPPPDSLAPPDFSAPPPLRPAQPVPRPTQSKPVLKRAAPSVAQPSQVRPAPAAPAESASSAPAPAAAAPATVAPEWNALLAAWLAANRRYPDEARRRSEEGEVTVRFTVTPGGQVSEAAIAKGSGFAALDAAALRLLQGATLPAPGIEATRTVRIRFRLND